MSKSQLMFSLGEIHRTYDLSLEITCCKEQIIPPGKYEVCVFEPGTNSFLAREYFNRVPVGDGTEKLETTVSFKADGIEYVDVVLLVNGLERSRRAVNLD